MNDQDLKFDLASKYADGYDIMTRDDAFGSFIDGWDAARANPIPVGAIIDVDQEALIQERDQLKAELEQLKNSQNNSVAGIESSQQ